MAPVGDLAMASTTSRLPWSATSVCHRKQVGLGETKLGVELIGELVARTTGAGAERATTLDHEVVDHPVEAKAIEVRLTRAAGVVTVFLGALGQTDKVVDRLRRVVGEQVDDDVAVVGVQGGLEVRHGFLFVCG